MKPKPNARPHGQLRCSQVVTTFGPGALVDLPTRAVLVGGLARDHVLAPSLPGELSVGDGA